MSKFVLTAQLQLQAPNNVGQVVQQIQNQLNGINVNIQVKGSQQAQKQIQQVTQSTNQATTAAERMGKAFALSIRRFAAFSIATRGVGLFTSSLSNAIQTAIDFERELIKVSQVTGKSIGQLRGLTNEITSLSTGLGVSSNDLLNVTTVLAQAGLTAEDTSKALRVLAKSALAPNFDSITETTEGAIAILAQFQEGVGALEAQLGSINAVAGAFAVEAGDLIDVVRRTGGVFKSSGGSLNELLALFTSVRATTRESAESIGTGLRTIFTRIQRPKTIEFLKQFGVELVDLNGKFVGPYEAIKRLSEALSGLGEGDLTFISIAEELGGFRQIGKVLPLLQQFSTAQSALNVAMKSGDSLTQDAASAQASLAIRIMKVREEFLALIRSVTETSTFQVMANTALSLASALIKIGDSIKPLLPMLAALAAFKIAKGLGGFFGGMMSGATSGRAYNKGGKVHRFASGGLVPGSGNGDTVPAMLSPGEFVIRKSSVNKMGAGTLAAMNSNRYAAGGMVTAGRYTYGGKPLTIAQISQHGDMSESYNKNSIRDFKKNNPAKYKELEEKAAHNIVKKKNEVEEEKNKKSTDKLKSKYPGGVFTTTPGAIGGFFLSPEKGSESPYTLSKPYPFKMNDGKMAVIKQGSQIENYLPFRKDVEKQAGLSNLINNSSKNSLSKAVTGISPQLDQLFSNKGINFNESSISNAANRLTSDNNGKINNAVSTVAGYVYEGVIDGITGATLAGGAESFDFPSVASNRSSLARMFGSNESEFATLIKGDAKRSQNSKSNMSIFKKIANDIKAGKVGLPNGILQLARGGLIQKFAGGGMAETPNLIQRGTLSYRLEDILKAGLTPAQFLEKIPVPPPLMAVNPKPGEYGTQFKIGGIGSGSIPMPKFLTPYVPPDSAAYESSQDAVFKKSEAAVEYRKKKGLMPRDYEGKSSTEKSFLSAKRRGYAAGGGVGTDTVPALLTPGEFVVNRRSAQGIGYGALNRMNKVGKYAKGGVVQHFASGSTGTGVKPSSAVATPGLDPKVPSLISRAAEVLAGAFTSQAQLIQQGMKAITLVNNNSWELADALVLNSTANNLTAEQDAKLRKAYGTAIQSMLNMGYTDDQIVAKSAELAAALDADSKAKIASKTASLKAAQAQAQASAVTGFRKDVMSSVESLVPGFSKSLSAQGAAYQRGAAEQEKLTAKIVENIAKWQSQGQSVDDMRGALVRFKDKLDRSTQKMEDLNPKSKKTKGGYAGAVLKDVQNDYRGYSESSATIALRTGKSKKEVAEGRKAALQDAGFTKGSERTKAILSGSQAPAPMTTADKIAAARAKAKTSSTPSGGSGSPVKSPSSGGMGNMMGDNKMMAASMATSMIQGFLPAVDESSSAMLKMTHSMLGLITTVASVGFALEAFGLKLNAQNIGSALGNIGSLFKKGGLAAMAGKAGGVATAGGVTQGGLGGMAAQGAFKSGLSATSSANIGAGVRVFTSALTKVAVPIAAAAATFYVLKTGGDMLVESFMGYEKKLKEATEKGNINKAREIATDQQTAKNRVTMGAGAAAGAVGGFILGGPAGALIGAAIGGVVADAFSELPEYAGAVAASQAAQIDAQNKLTKATEESGKALEEYSKGTKSGLEVVKTSVAASEAVAKSRIETNKANALGLKDRGGISGALGIGAASRLKDSEQRTKAQNKLEEKALNVSMPGLNALGRDVALASGSFEDFQAKIKEVNPELFNIIVRQGSVELKKNFDNIAKETEKAKKAFEALNLNLRAPSATAMAASSGLSNFNANLEVGSNPVEQSMSALEASFSEAGQAMDPAEVKAAIGGVAATLEEFGGSDKAVSKFKENAEAFASVSQNYNEIFEGVKDDFTDADFRGLNVDQFNEKFAANVDEQLKNSGIGDEARERMKDVIGDIKLSDDDMKKLRGGDFSVYQKYLDEAGQKTLEEAKKVVAETAKINQQLISLTKQRIEAERGLIQAQQEAIDLTMEGREIQGKYGGRAVTGQERKDSLLAKSNVESNRLGLSAMNTGDVGDLRRRNSEISAKFSDIEGKRSQQGGLSGKSGVEADATQQDLQKAYKTQIDTIRGLIKLEEDQLKIIEEKNKLEKESMESLIKGDIEEFFKKQSAVGATAAIASGDTRLQNLYGADALGTASMDIKRQQDAGVQTLYGQQLAGPGGLTEAASSAALSSRGVTDMRAAQVMAGTTAEEEASKTRLRELGGMLGETGQLGTEMAEMQVNTATINVNSAELKLEEIKSRGKAASEEAQDIENRPAIARAKGGMIYANRGIFVPRGTDTVPAMLTPGEFVINRGAVQRGNNLQILQAMNSGAGGVSSVGGTALMAQGGPVRYFSDGGKNGPAGNGGGMFENMTNFVTSLSNFGLQLKDSIGKLTDTNISIKLDSSAININLNDGGVLKALTSQVKTEIFNLVKNNLVAGEGGRLKESSSILP